MNPHTDSVQEEVSYEVWIGDECAAMATDATEASRYAAQYELESSDPVEVYTVYSRKVPWQGGEPAAEPRQSGSAGEAEWTATKEDVDRWIEAARTRGFAEGIESANIIAKVKAERAAPTPAEPVQEDTKGDAS